MWKKVFIGLIFMVASLSITFIFYNHSLNAASGYLVGGNINGRVGPLQKYDKFYIYTNQYSFKVVNNNTRGTLALSDIPIGNITWTDESASDLMNSYRYSKSNYYKMIQSMNQSIDNRDKRILSEYVKPQLQGTDDTVKDFNNIPSDAMPYFIGNPFLQISYGAFGSDIQNLISYKNGVFMADTDFFLMMFGLDILCLFKNILLNIFQVGQ